MAEYLPLPNSVIITISAVGDTENLVVCLTQNDFTGNSNNTTLDTFCGKEQLPGSQDQTLNISYRRVWNPDTGHTSEIFLYRAWKDKTHLQWTIGPETPTEDGTPIYTGTGYMLNYSNQNGTNALPTGSFTLSADEPMEVDNWGTS